MSCTHVLDQILSCTSHPCKVHDNGLNIAEGLVIHFCSHISSVVHIHSLGMYIKSPIVDFGFSKVTNHRFEWTVNNKFRTAIYDMSIYKYNV